MRKLAFIPVLAIVAATACTGSSNQSENKSSESIPVDNYVKGLNLSNLDTTANPGESFYQFATGGWQKSHPLTPEYARYGTFDKLGEDNATNIKNIITKLGSTEHKYGTIEQKIGDLYELSIDSVTRNREGSAPIQSDLKDIESAQTKIDLIKKMGSIRYFATDPFFYSYVGVDEKNSDQYIVTLRQGGLGMGDRDYYINADSKALRDGYVAMIEKQFINAGFPESKAKEASQNIMNIETSLAKTHITKEQSRIPEKNYNKMKLSELNSKVAKFNWGVFFNSTGMKNFNEVNVQQIEPIKAAISLIDSTPMPALKQYLLWSVIRSSANSLSDDFYATSFDFYGKQLSGRQSPKPRWKRAVSAINSALGEAVGQMYVKEYFPAESKERMLKLVDNLRVSLSERIDNSAWMSETTKEKAQDKLNSFIVKIGYPDKWRDYSSLVIKKDSYYANMKRANEFEYNFELSKLGKPVDKMEWGMTPQTVNAYYNPTTNEICFPAGILQPPFFFKDADDAVNYGAIGVVIGHEMTHGFDDQGSKYDKEGNMVNWWTEEDAKKFVARTNVLRDHFNNIIVLDTLHSNGVFTLGENIADQGGLQVSYNAFLKTEESKSNTPIGGYTPSQRFFLSYSNVWGQNIRDEEIRNRVKSDPHSLGKWRVDGALPQVDAWYTAFGITEKDPLYIPKEKRVAIW